MKTTHEITLNKLIREAQERQRFTMAKANRGFPQKTDYGLQAELVLEMLGHLMEECQEVRDHLPRKYWKVTEKNSLETTSGRWEVLEEYADCFLILFAISAYAHFSPEEVVGAIEAKVAKNASRPDHVTSKPLPHKDT